MIIGPKYKLARRLGAPVFEKTQTAKFAASKEKKTTKFARPKSAFGAQLNEKQKARFTYGISEKQFKNYVNVILAKKSTDPQNDLFKSLETRLDNTVFRAGFARTRREARQLVGHGHVTVNGKRLSIPSYTVREKDVIGMRVASKGKGVLASFDERFKDTTLPAWLSWNKETKEATVIGVPKANPTELMFDMAQIIEYYRR
ncbi:MAG: 30S ribosomal protein S4 [Candidatus Paceibacterota bacterium]|jgi:small subunit ribosomal protein S4